MLDSITKSRQKEMIFMLLERLCANIPITLDEITRVLEPRVLEATKDNVIEGLMTYDLLLDGDFITEPIMARGSLRTNQEVFPYNYRGW